jgi:peptidoglycan hydrolase-like protein with peptidoglycan-binding domain
MILPFQGNAGALTSDGLASVAGKLNVHAPEIWTVLAVETSGCGYLPDRRPQILFERHIFHRLTNGQFDDGDISDPSPGGYGAPGAAQYDRLARAISKNRSAALQSTSWGIGQVMGLNFAKAGFQSVDEMVTAMLYSEDQQLAAVGNFLASVGLAVSLRVHNWASFARIYNGPNYAINRYDIRLSGEFQKCSAMGLPDLNIRAAQLYLTYLGFHPGPIDGIAGDRTMAALAQFQVKRGLPISPSIDSGSVAQLWDALTRVSALGLASDNTPGNNLTPLRLEQVTDEQVGKMTNEQDTSVDGHLTAVERAALIARMKAAWAILPEDKRDALKPMLDAAHQQFADYVQKGTVPAQEFHQVLRMKSYLNDDWDNHLQTLDSQVAAEAIEINVGPGGEILGTGKYEVLDPLWELEAGTVWLENLLHKHPFPTGTPSRVEFPDQAVIAIAGDFGTGNFGAFDSPSVKISKFVPTLNPDFTIHLGDVYYAGLSGEERSKLIDWWPKGKLASFTLNSNHEMYSGGTSYFNDAVGGPVFNKFQSPYSFFALENSSWLVVGLDSAYSSGVMDLYMNGSLGQNAQLPFLRDIATRGATLNKKVIVLTHHNGLPEDGVQTSPPLRLFTEVLSAFAGVPPPAYWYWGHKHMGAVYKPLAAQNGMLCRCVGHGALPWGFASALKDSQKVEWFEQCNAKDPESPLRVYNGFVVLTFDGPNMTEAFYDETGRVAWTPKNGDMRNCKP